MFYLQKELDGVKEILDFYIVPHTHNPQERIVGRIVGWEKKGIQQNTIYLPTSEPCKLLGINVLEKQENVLASIKPGPAYADKDGENNSVRVPLTFYNIETNSDIAVLAEIIVGDKRFPGIIQVGDDQILFAFDIAEVINKILLYRYLSGTPSAGLLNIINRVGAAVATKLPLGLRNYLIKSYLKLAKNTAKDAGFPTWPMDRSVDALRDLFLKTLVLVSNDKEVFFISPWPKGKTFCFCSTHDVDTVGGFKNIPFVRKEERALNMPSTWFVTHEINPDVEFLKELVADGCEVGSHGWMHDDRLGLITPEEVGDRCKKSAEQFKGITLKGFRAPYNGFHPRVFEEMRKYFSYDASSQEARIYASVKSHRLGCCTLFPYDVDGFIELPSTMPPDYLLINTLEYDPEKVYQTWEEKLSKVRNAQGMALMQTHPEEFDIGNPRFIVPYRKILEKVSSMEGCYIATAADVAAWWKKRASCRIDIDSGGPHINSPENIPVRIRRISRKTSQWTVEDI